MSRAARAREFAKHSQKSIADVAKSLAGRRSLIAYLTALTCFSFIVQVISIPIVTLGLFNMGTDASILLLSSPLLGILFMLLFIVIVKRHR